MELANNLQNHILGKIDQDSETYTLQSTNFEKEENIIQNNPELIELKVTDRFTEMMMEKPIQKKKKKPCSIAMIKQN